MNSRKKVIGIAVGLALSASIQAAPIVLPTGPVYFQFNNLEQLDTSLSNGITVPGGAGYMVPAGLPASEGNWGVFNVSSMQYGTVTTPNQDIGGGAGFWGYGLSAGQVSGIFYGITTTGATTATGGYIDLWWNDTALLSSTDISGTTTSPTDRTAANLAGDFTPSTTGSFLARFEFATGIKSDGSNTTISSNIDITNITGSGQADSFANIVDVNGDGVIDASDGAWAAVLNGDWFNVDPSGTGTIETRDLRFSNFFNLFAGWDGTSPITGLRSNDPGRVFVVSVPEPATMALMGLGLAGVGFSSRRRRAR
jgi:hypothetical protein